MAKATTTQILTTIKEWVLGKLADVWALIPSQASSSNQLADKAFVNSSIATATATFRGTYNLVSDLSLTTSATQQQIAAAIATEMEALGITPDSNDYAFVQIPTADATPTQIAKIEKYKYNGTAWGFEYELNNSGFTAAQWAAINSGATLELIGKLSALPTNTELTALLDGKQNVISDLVTIRSGASAGATAVQPAALSAALVQTVAESGVFDLSAHNAVNGVLATYADLSAALTALNALDSKYKYGGMSFKFVQSSDNKYVQYRLMSDTFNTTLANWQGVDDEPTVGSENLVKSGSIGIRLERLDNIIEPNNNLLGEDVNEYYPVTIHIGDYFTVSTSDGSVFAPSYLTIYCYDENKVQRDNFILGSINSNSRIIQYNKAQTCKYLKLNVEPNVPLMVNYGNQALPYTPYVKPLSKTYETIEDTIIIKKNIGAISSNLIGNNPDEYYSVNIEYLGTLTVSTSDGEAFDTSGLQILCYDENKNQTNYYSLLANDTFRTITYDKRTTCRFIKLNKTPRVPLMATYGNTVKTYEPYLLPIRNNIEEMEQEIDSLDERVTALDGTNANIVGDDWTKMYPFSGNGVEKLTISSPDWTSEYDSYGLQLIGYDENGQKMLWYYGVSNLPKTIVPYHPGDVKYLGWNKPLPCKIKVEIGDIATNYIEYKGSCKLWFPSGWETAALSAYNACISKMSELTCDGIPIFIESDIHKNIIMLNPFKWIDNKDTRFKQINLGDNLAYANEHDWAKEFYKEGKELSNYICVAGNHDIEVTPPELAFIDYESAEQLYTSLSVNYKRPSQRPFFISYDNKYSVKYIVTCPYYNEDYDSENPQTFENRKFKAAQVDWLIEELSKDDGYDIVMLMHQLVNPTGYKDRNNTSVTTPDSPYIGLWQLYKDRRNKTSGTITDSEGVTHSYDFTNCKNDFLCSFQGHWHQELMLAEDNTVSYVSTTTGAIDVSTGGYTKGACTIALIDRESKHLYIWAFSGDGVKDMLTFNI